MGNHDAFWLPYRSCILRVMTSDGQGWEHVSVSLPNRYPNWREMCIVKGLCWDAEDLVMQYHPAKSAYVNVHDHCLHLWRPIGQKDTDTTEGVGRIEKTRRPGGVRYTGSQRKNQLCESVPVSRREPPREKSNFPTSDKHHESMTAEVWKFKRKFWK